METAVIIGVMVAVVMVIILLIVITVFVTVLVCMKHKTKSESERRRRSKVCPLRPLWSSVCLCVRVGHNSLTELIVVVLCSALSDDLTHYKSFKLLICMW